MSSIPPSSPESYRIIFINDHMLLKCVACGYRTRDSSMINLHIKKNHGPTARSVCGHCTLTYLNAGSLALHMTRIHPEVIHVERAPDEPAMDVVIADGCRIYRCNLCLYVLRTKAKCRQHIKNSHSLEGQYFCDMCSCRFMDSGTLGQHKYQMHRLDEITPGLGNAVDLIPSTTETRPYCTRSRTVAKGTKPGNNTAELNQEDGPTSDSNYNDLSAVMSSPRAVTMQNARYSTASERRNHYCSKCSFSSTNSHNLAQHETVAHIENGYKCSFCPCSFAAKACLSGHAKAHKKKLVNDLRKNMAKGSSAAVQESTTEVSEPRSAPEPVSNNREEMNTLIHAVAINEFAPLNAESHLSESCDESENLMENPLKRKADDARLESDEDNSQNQPSLESKAKKINPIISNLTRPTVIVTPVRTEVEYPSDDDEIIIVYESTSDMPASTKSLKPEGDSTAGAKQLTVEEVESNESLLCYKCGYISESVEEAREHNLAIMDTVSLICFICAYMANHPCDSFLHEKLHKEKDFNDLQNVENSHPIYPAPAV